MGRARGFSRTTGPARRLALALLVLAAVMLRGLTPAGWMPNPQGGLGAPFVICTASGAELVQLDARGQPGHPQPGKSQPARHADLCAFAGHHAAPAPTPAAASAALTYVSFTPPDLAGSATRAAVARRREQAPRAPPTSI